MPVAIEAIAGFGQGSTNGLVTGNTASRVFNSATGTLGTDIQIIAGAAFNGAPFGLRISGANNFVRWDTNTIGAGRTSVVFAFWWRASTDPSGLKEIFVFDLTTAGTDFASIDYIPASNVLRWFGPGGSVDSGTVNPNTDYFVEGRYTISSGTHTFVWRINGVAQTGLSGAQAADTFAGVVFGDRSSGATGASDFGHIALSFTSGDYPLGPHQIETLKVDASDTVTLSGTAANFQTFTGATPTKSAWNATTARNAVDELPPNVTSAQDGWCQITTAASDYVQMPMETYTLAPGEVIKAARLLAAVWTQDATGAFLGIRSFNGTTETTLFGASIAISGNNTASIPWVAEMLTLADIDTQSELDALCIRAGFSSDAAPDVGLHAVYVEVAIFTGNGQPTPATVAAVASLPAAHPNIGASPAVAATAVSIPQVTAIGESGTTVAEPATVASVVAVPRPAVNVAASPATVAAAAALPRPSVDVAAVPVVLAAVAAVPRPAGNTGASPAVLAAAASLPAAHPNVSAVPAVLAAVAGIPTPTVLAGGSASPSPAPVALVAAVLAPALSVRAGPALVALLAALARPLVGTAPVPAPVGAIAALARPGGSVGAGPAVAAVLVGLARPGVDVAAVPGVVLAVVGVPTPVVVATTSATALPDTVALVATVLAVAAAGGAVQVGPAIMSGVDRAGAVLDATHLAATTLTGSDIPTAILSA